MGLSLCFLWDSEVLGFDKICVLIVEMSRSICKREYK